MQVQHDSSSSSTVRVVISDCWLTCVKLRCLMKLIKYPMSPVKTFRIRVFRRTWTDTEELLKEKTFFILSFHTIY